MTTNNEFMVTILGTESEFDHAAAQRILQQMRRKPDSVIGLSTGRTTYNIHRLVAKGYADSPFDISGITFFGVDEVVGVDREYSGACYKMLRTELIDDLGVDDSHFLMLPTRSAHFDQACSEFTAELNRRGGIDLLMLGLGENGHLGFNQPGTDLDQTAWVTDMNPELEERIRRETQTPAGEWLGGITLGLYDIMNARSIVLVAKGSHKAEAVQRMLCGKVSEDCPASILQRHGGCEFLLDEAAAALAKGGGHAGMKGEV